MGNCFPFFKINRNKYQENLETPPQKLENIQLNSEEFISGVSAFEDYWAVSQENMISLFKGFSSFCFWNTAERVRTVRIFQEKVWTAGKNLEIFDFSGKQLGLMVGHERPINSFDISSTSLVSGGGDWTVRLWDTEKCSEISKSLINWNVVTSLKWVDEKLIVQASEDLRIRLWDIRTKGLSESNSMSVGDNFATTLDVLGNDLISGHRGFSGNGCDVKWWDFRKMQVVSSVRAHDMPVEVVKFFKDSVVSCGKDGRIVRYEQQKVEEIFEHVESRPFSSLDVFKDGILVANNEPKILYFTVDPFRLRF
jgi:WD40 repeat protein